MGDAREITLHMIGHGHIDPTWMWRWTEGCEEVRATFRSALERMRETPGFKFTASSACFYAWIKETEPELYKELSQRVAQGRWEIAGGWWLEPDCNTPCGEAIVRQGLYGQRFFAQEFGVRVKVGFNPDSFGHAATFPQILKQLGQDYYAFMRPMAGVEKNYPGGDTFWWEAPDGTRVLTANIHESYNTNLNDAFDEAQGHSLEQIEDELHARFGRASKYPNANPAQRDVLFFFGVGNHGGGPTKTSIRAIEEWQGALAKEKNQIPLNPPFSKGEAGGRAAEKIDVNVEFSTLQKYFSSYEENIPAACVPVMAGEMQHHARGCYSLCHAIKVLNRRTEHALMTAERLSVAARLKGLCEYPKDALEQAWKDLLYNQFHDILAGTSLPSALEDARDQLGAARHAAHTIINRAVQAFAQDLDTTAPGNTVLVFNSLPWVVRVLVEVSEGVERTADSPAYVEHRRVRFLDDAGQEVPSQAVTGERVGGRKYFFLAELPALGGRAFSAFPYRLSEAPPASQPAGRLEVSTTALENRWWRVEIDGNDGGVSRLVDKVVGQDVLARGARLVAFDDASDTWSHGVKEWRVVRGHFDGASVSVAEDGAVLGRVRALSFFGRSEAVCDYTLYRDAEFFDIELRVNWQEKYSVLKWVMDTALAVKLHSAECAYGRAARELGSGEEPCQQSAAVEGTLGDAQYSLAVLNDGVFGYDVQGQQLRLTLLRSPAFAHHDPCAYDPAGGHAIMDQGWHTFRLRILPGGAVDPARVAWEFNVAPIAHIESAHTGGSPCLGSFVGIDAPGVVVSVVKMAEDGNAVIVRAYETLGRATAGTLRLAGTEFAVQFGPHEIKTFRFDHGSDTFAECNLLEE